MTSIGLSRTLRVPELNGFEATLATNEDMPYILMALEVADDIAVDTETSGLNVRNGVDYLMGICVDVPGLSAYLPFRHKESNLSREWLEPLAAILRKKPLIWHNRKFDMHSLKTIGVNPLSFEGPQYDTLMIAQLVDEELFSKEMDFLAKKFLKTQKYGSDELHAFGKIYGFDNVPAQMYQVYGSYDANITRRLRDVLWPMLKRQGLDAVYWETECPFTRLLYKIEQRGVGVNSEFCEDKARIGRGRMATIQRELGFNPASPLDIGRYLIDELKLPVLAHTSSCDKCPDQPVHTHEGRASFNKRVMEDYDDILANMDNPTARLITEYRGWQKAVTSLYEPMLEKVGPDGRIRTEFKQHGTVTGRLSASNPNLQQIPRGSAKPWNGNAKSAFHSGREGYTLIGWDYSQLELRLAAAYGQEQLLLAEFEKPDADPFNVLAPLIFGVLTPETRHETKTFVYANLYGAGVRKIALQLGRTVEETEALYRRYQAAISGVINVSRQVAQLVEKRGYVKYWDGRRRHMRIRSESYKAWNSVCQGGGAQLVKKAMLRCEEFEDDNCFMVLQVHDEITFAIKTEMIDHYEPMIIKAMTDFPQFGVKMHVEGKAWK